jgi:hypothetical protein
MLAKAGPSSKELKTEKDIETFLENDAHSIIGFFSSIDSDLYAEYKKVSDELSEKYRFGHTTIKSSKFKYEK